MNRISAILAVFALAPATGWAQSDPASAANGPGFDQIVDRAIVQESTLLKILRGEHPLAETYIQEMMADADFGAVPKADHYFLGKLDLSHGITTDSFTPSAKHIFDIDIFKHVFSMQYLPRGFAQMILIDGVEFDRAHYDFELIRREFLGDVRTWVIDVSPKKNAGRGRFIGRIWVEDREFNIVRFNGIYGPPKAGELYMHFDSWRVNAGPDLWVPYETYSEESALPYAMHLRKLRFKAVTRIWGYTTAEERNAGDFTNIVVDLPAVQDKSDQSADNSPVESQRAWERESEDNVLGRLEKANLLAPRGEVDKILDTVVNNLIVTNNLNIEPEVRTRVILTTPLETFSVGHTIVISRGLLDTLPDEASLAALLAHELAHIALGHEVDTKFAFSDRVIFDDDRALQRFRFARPPAQEEAANQEAMTLLEKSPYNDNLRQAGLYLKALGAEADRLPALIKPLFGDRMADGHNVLRLAALMEKAPELQRTHTDQIAALPLGARTSLDPWTAHLRMAHMRAVPLLYAREKMAFEITPVFLHLTYQSSPSSPGDQIAKAPEPSAQ